MLFGASHDAFLASLGLASSWLDTKRILSFACEAQSIQHAGRSTNQLHTSPGKLSIGIPLNHRLAPTPKRNSDDDKLQTFRNASFDGGERNNCDWIQRNLESVSKETRNIRKHWQIHQSFVVVFFVFLFLVRSSSPNGRWNVFTVSGLACEKKLRFSPRLRSRSFFYLLGVLVMLK